jgi:HSP20 family molecular chaperone IbpA
MPTHRHPEHRHAGSYMPVPLFPWWRSFGELFRDDEGHQVVAVEEFTEDNTLVVKAELPGIDPDKDVDITISGWGAPHPGRAQGGVRGVGEELSPP